MNKTNKEQHRDTLLIPDEENLFQEDCDEPESLHVN